MNNIEQLPPDCERILQEVINHHAHAHQSLDFEKRCLALCQIIAKVSGLKLTNTTIAPATPLELHSLLKTIAHNNQLHLREFRLKKNWQNYDCGPFIALYNNRPCALLYQGRLGYFLLDPEEEKPRKLTSKMVNEIASKAYLFCPTLPKDNIRIKDLLSFLFYPFKKEITHIIVLQLFISVLLLTIPLFTGYLLDSIIPQANINYLLQTTLLLSLVIMVLIIIQLMQTILFLQLTIKTQYRIQVSLWDRLLRLPLPFFRRFSAGDLHFRCSVLNAIQEQLQSGSIQAFVTSLLSILNLIIMFSINTQLSITVIAFLLVMIIVTWFINRRTLREQREVVNQEIHLNSTLLSFINSIAKIRVNHEEQHAFQWWGQFFSAKMKHHRNALQYQNYLQVFSLGWMGISTLTIYGLVIWLGTQLSFGQFIIFNAAFTQFFSALILLANTLVECIEIAPLYHKVQPIFHEPLEKSIPASDDSIFKGNIVFNQVLFRYPQSEKPLFIDFNLTIEPQSFVAIVGSSGAGKSTLLRLLLNLETIDSGSIKYNGIDLQQIDINYLRSHIGVILQSTKIIPGTIFENIAGRNTHLSREEAWEIIKQVGLEEVIHDLPMGIDTLINDGIQTLSGGEMQRINLARAISAKPRILLLDEATSALDNKVQYEIQQFLHSLPITRIVVAHRLSTIRHADMIHVIEQGRCIESGNYEELLQAKGAFFRMLKS